MKAVPNEFLKFAKHNSDVKKTSSEGINCVIYTRVSTKEQADNNLSLQTQLKACKEYAQKQNYNVLECFGGTHESAKTDERKEFNRMLGFVRRNKEKVSNIIVYSVDRFSRSGANAIAIAADLKKEGISVYAVTQPLDATTSSGSLQQNMYFIFSEFENNQRREKCMAGTREKLLSGRWSTTAPIGYDNVRVNGEKTVAINETGKLIRKAFEWKANEGLSHLDIIARLKEKGLVLCKQTLSKILKNPFYCGLIVHKMLDGQIIEGKHEKLISKELFLRVNDVLQVHPHGWKCCDEDENLPLKKFMLCEKCGKPMRGYIVKRKRIHYYKCGTTGCCVNENAKRLNSQFYNMLLPYTFPESMKEALRIQLEAHFHFYQSNAVAQTEIAENDLLTLEKRIKRLGERLIEEEITSDLYKEYLAKFKDEKKNIEDILKKLSFSASNLSDQIENALNKTMNIADYWSKSSYNTKQRIQRVVYPDGIMYDAKNKQCRTVRVNKVLELIASISAQIEAKKEGTQTPFCVESLSVERKGFELLP